MAISDIVLASSGAAQGGPLAWMYTLPMDVRQLLAGQVPVFPTRTAPVGAVTVPIDTTDLEAWFPTQAAGTKFWFTPGHTYRLSGRGFEVGDLGILAKDNDQFLTDPANPAVLKGSTDIGNTGWTASGTHWWKAYTTAQVAVQGTGSTSLCIVGGVKGGTLCANADDVYINNVQQLHVGSVANVTAGEYFIDYVGDKIYIGEDPTGKTIEVAHIRFGITGATSTGAASAADNVTVEGLVVTQFANTSQYGAISTTDNGKNWTIRYCYAWQNHAAGISFGNGALVEWNRLEYNGHAGLKCLNPVVGPIPNPSGATVRYNRIVGNKLHGKDEGYNASWEGGGTKFGRMAYVVVRYNYTALNNGSALWLDVANYNAQIRYNVCHGDFENGSIHDEGSYNSEISYNLCLFGGKKETGGDTTNWPHGTGVKISTSNRTNAHHNIIIKCRASIGVLEQNRDADINYNRIQGGTDLVPSEDPPGTQNPVKEVHQIEGCLVEDNFSVMQDTDYGDGRGVMQQWSGTVRSASIPLIEAAGGSVAFTGGVLWRRNQFYVDTASQRFKFNGSNYTGAVWQSTFPSYVSANTFTAIASWSDAWMPVGLTS